jgi:CheY-like chemotaxis protein
MMAADDSTAGGAPGEKLGKVVLLVDDDPAFRADLHQFLESRGYRVLEASNGDEALDIMTDEPVNVMVTDLVMPGLNGFELLRVARQRNAGLAFQSIAITGTKKIDESLRTMLASLGARTTLQKPINLEALLRAIVA